MSQAEGHHPIAVQLRHQGWHLNQEGILRDLSVEAEAEVEAEVEVEAEAAEAEERKMEHSPLVAAVAAVVAGAVAAVAAT